MNGEDRPHKEDRPRGVRFDRQHPERTMALEVAEEMLTAWRERSRSNWGYWHSAAFNGVEPTKTNPRAK